MDANSTPQTVAQAVQAATQQQQSPVQPSAQSSTIDNLTCQWQGCGERCDSAEALYDHVCERHVGRKSTNNLNLTCQWGACRTTTVKRDHITSHIRVHVPLKPHKCDFCGKAFKRPQDLKKHVKTHADDSVLMNSPSGGNSGRGSIGGGGMGQQNGKSKHPATYPVTGSGVSDLLYYTASGYYPASHDHSMGNPYPTYQPALGSNAQNGQYPQPTSSGQYAGYGSVSYPNNAAMQDIQSMDTRRRAIEALNDFLGDIKRRALDPHNYYDVGQRLQSTALPLPVGGGYNTGYSGAGYQNYSAASLLEAFNSGNMGGSGGSHGGVATQGYSLPLPNARTKNDLQDIDRFLEQLQATVYESSNQAAAAGVVQPGTHTMHTGENFGLSNHQTQYRSSNSPPNYSNAGGVGGVNALSGEPMPSPTAPLDTPVLTPASVSSSYASSGQSPMSNHSRASVGSNQMYPNLPSVTGMSDLGAGYPTTTSAPASSLASAFEGLDDRRYSGGRLQRQAPGQDTEMMDADDRSRTPKASDPKRTKSKVSSIDPALRGEDEKSSSESVTTPVDDKRQEEWIENIRIIEALKKWVEGRLKNGEYEDDEPSNADKDGSDKNVEIAKLVEEKMADADSGAVKYPTLPSK